MKLAIKLRRNIVALSCLQATNYIVPLISVPYLVRVLHPAGFGLISFAQALIFFFAMATDYGFNLSTTRTVAACREDHEALSRTFWLTISTKLLLMAASAIVLGMVVLFSHNPKDTGLLYGAAFLNVIGTALFPVWLFQGLEEMKTIVIAQASARILTIPGIFLLVHKPQDYLIAAAIQGSVLIWASFFIAPATWKRVHAKPHFPSVSELASTFRDGWHLFISNIAGFSYSSATVLILGLVAGKTEVGYYSAAEKLIRAAISLIQPLTQALYPHLSALRVQCRNSALRLVRKSLSWVSLFSLTTSVSALCFAGPIGHVVFGASFGPAVNVLRCLSPLPFLYALTSVFGNLTLIVFEMDASISRILFRCTLVNVILSLGLSMLWGAVGAATATIVTAIVMATYMASTLKRNQLAFWSIPQEPIAGGVVSLPAEG